MVVLGGGAVSYERGTPDTILTTRVKHGRAVKSIKLHGKQLQLYHDGTPDETRAWPQT